MGSSVAMVLGRRCTTIMRKVATAAARRFPWRMAITNPVAVSRIEIT
jgi:hypothetical protein